MGVGVWELDVRMCGSGDVTGTSRRADELARRGRLEAAVHRAEAVVEPEPSVEHAEPLARNRHIVVCQLRGKTSVVDVGSGLRAEKPPDRLLDVERGGV